jgi:hypothetical protein
MTAALLIAAPVGFAVGAFSLRPPLHPECDKNSRQYDPKEVHCEKSEPLWERTLDDPLLIYNALLTCFTAILAGVGITQGVLIGRQIRLGREEFNASHRPRLRVRNINVRRFGETAVTAAGRIRNPSIGDVFSGQMYVSNIGDGDARIIDGYLSFFAAKYPLPMERPYEGENGNLLAGPHHHWMAPGESFTLLFDHPLVSQDRVPGPGSFISETEVAIYAMGWIEYEDRRSRVMRTSFCRRYDVRLWRFMSFRSAFPDYEAEE